MERPQQALLDCFGVPGRENDFKLGRIVRKGSKTARWKAISERKRIHASRIHANDSAWIDNVGEWPRYYPPRGGRKAR